MSSPTVSVTLPTFNRADVLPDVIESILNQNYQDFELIILDDGSTDRTEEVITSITKGDNRVRYIPLPRNKGIGYARCAALQHARGHFVALADSDDKWLPGKLKVQVEALELHPEIDILFSNFYNIDLIRGISLTGFDDAQAGMVFLKKQRLADDLWIIESGIEKGLLVNDFIGTPTVIVRARIFTRVGGFDSSLHMGEDFEFFWRAAVLGARFGYLDRVLLERYRCPSSSTARIVEAAIQMLQAFPVFRETAKAVNRPELLGYIGEAEHQVWRRLLWHYGRGNERGQVAKVYWKSLRYGFSPHTFIFFLTGLVGSKFINCWAALRMRRCQI